MLFNWQIIVFLFYFFLPCHTLRCTTECSFTSTFTQPFNIPDRCNQTISARQCFASLRMSYTDQTYTIDLQSNPTSQILPNHRNSRTALMTISSTLSTHFDYNVEIVCKDTDNCGIDLLRNATIDLLQRQYNISSVSNELAPLISNRSSLTTLDCYNSNGDITECGTPSKPELCNVLENIKENSINRSCSYNQWIPSPYVSIYQMNNYSTFYYTCNRSLCNDNSTLDTIKKLMFKYKITTGFVAAL